MIDLNEKFNLINKICFDGKLKSIPIEFGPSDKNDGIFMAWSEGPSVYYCIEMSAGLKNNEASLVPILIHEMVHYWLDVHGIEDKHHGLEFTKRLKLADDDWGKYQLENLRASDPS